MAGKMGGRVEAGEMGEAREEGREAGEVMGAGWGGGREEEGEVVRGETRIQGDVGGRVAGREGMALEEEARRRGEGEKVMGLGVSGEVGLAA